MPQLNVDLAESDPLIKIRDVAQLLNISRAQAFKLCAEGHLTVVRISERCNRVPLGALAAYISAKTNANQRKQNHE